VVTFDPWQKVALTVIAILFVICVVMIANGGA